MEVNRTSILRFAGWMLFLLSSLGFLLLAGGERLTAPPLRSPGEWGTWLADRDPTTVAVAVLRVGGIAFAIYLVTVTVIAVLASALSSRGLTKASSQLTMPWLRHTLGGLLGAGLVVASLPQHSPGPVDPESAARSGPAEVAGADPRDPATGLSVTTVVAAAADPSADDSNGTGGPREEGSPVVMLLLPDKPAPVAPPTTAVAPPTMALDEASSTEPSGTTASSVQGQAPDQSPGAGPPEQATTYPAQPSELGPTPAPADISHGESDSWVIEPGDHLWHVAESVLTDGLVRTPSDADIAAYWTVLIEANRSMLVDPSNPDLVFAGQVVTLPPLRF